MRILLRAPSRIVLLALALTAGSAAFAVDRVRTVPGPAAEAAPPAVPAPATSATVPPPAAAASASVGPGSPAAGRPVAGPAARGDLSVTVDRAKVVRLPETAQTVILGNPSIADIAVQKNGLAILTGKSYGVTNLIALDASGAMLAESVVSVVAPNDALVTVQRGLERQSLSCTPACQPSVMLGDAQTYFSDVKGQADQHRAFSTQR